VVKTITIVGSKGFIGKNLNLYFKSLLKKNKIYEINRKTSKKEFITKINSADVIINCAGVNRSIIDENFDDNFKVCGSIINNLKPLKKVKLIHISTTRVNDESVYGITKKKAEKKLISNNKPNLSVKIIRCPNIFGKWSKPEYNSAVATFCHNVSRNKISKLFNEDQMIKLLYIDDLCKIILDEINSLIENKTLIKIEKKYIVSTTPRIILEKLEIFHKYRYMKMIPEFKDKFTRNLYSTFLTYLPKKKFKYPLKKISDKRGSFVEFIKSDNFGQVSFLKINSKLSRGNHYHMSKVEKFLLLNGKCKFEFRNMKNTSEKINFIIDSKNTEVIETIPGWLHSLKNLSNYPIYLIIWANEIFDKKNTDTYEQTI
jgi:UDP-2-acetamido-2,6-beta-L-arabino-hexul-4-ose reductase